MSSTALIKTGSLVRQSVVGRCLPRLLASTRTKCSVPGISRLVAQSNTKACSPVMVVRHASDVTSKVPSKIVEDIQYVIEEVIDDAKVDPELKKMLLELSNVSSEPQLKAVLDKMEIPPKLKECLLKEYKDVMEGMVMDATPDFKAQMMRIQMYNEMYYGELRDKKNFPILAERERPPAVKLLIFPKTWFEALYSRTGVTGPYIFLTAMFGTLVSKEIYVIDKYFIKEVGFIMAVGWLVKKFGPQVNEFLDKQNDENDQTDYYKPIADVKNEIRKGIEKCEQNKFAIEAMRYVNEAEKEYLELQMEAIYRERMQKVYTDVKARLDYQMDVQNARRRFEQEHMVNWITKNVLKSITPQQEKQNLAECIATLKKLSQTQTAA